MKKFELSIPKPCHENWEAMTPEDKGRFCGACKKTVVDFTDMSDRQIAEFFKTPRASVCGRFGGDQLNRVVGMPRKRIPWVKYFFTIALPAFLISKKSAAQGEVKRTMGKVAVHPKPVTGYVDITLQQAQTSTSRTISGKVTDEKGEPLEAATVSVKGTSLQALTDKDGKFVLKNVDKDKRELTVSSVGFITSTIVAYEDTVSISLAPALSGEVVITMGIVVRKKLPSVPLLQPKRDTSTAAFSVYPNPVSSNAAIMLRPKNLQDGRYILAVVNAAGEVVQTEEIIVEKKTKIYAVKLKEVGSGAYFLRLTNTKTNKSDTQTIVVQ